MWHRVLNLSRSLLPVVLIVVPIIGLVILIAWLTNQDTPIANDLAATKFAAQLDSDTSGLLGKPLPGIWYDTNELDNRKYTVQYTEYAILEWHPELRQPHDILLVHIGTLLYRRVYPDTIPIQTPNFSQNSLIFRETGKRIGGQFLEYWHNHGEKALLGLPITDEFEERSSQDGVKYLTQYFERAVLQLRPQNPYPNNVQRLQIGRSLYISRHGSPLDQLRDNPEVALRGFFLSNPLAKSFGIPLLLLFIVYLLDLLASEGKTIRPSPDLAPQVSLNLLIGALALDFTTLLEYEWRASSVGMIMLIHVFLLACALLSIKQYKNTSLERRGVRVTWGVFAVILGFMGMVLSLLIT